MITQDRKELMRVLERLSETYPEMRLGQLVANLSYLAKEPSNEAIWDVEDAELIAAARQMLEQRNSPSASVA